MAGNRGDAGRADCAGCSPLLAPAGPSRRGRGRNSPTRTPSLAATAGTGDRVTALAVDSLGRVRGSRSRTSSAYPGSGRSSRRLLVLAQHVEQHHQTEAPRRRRRTAGSSPFAPSRTSASPASSGLLSRPSSIFARSPPAELASSQERVDLGDGQDPLAGHSTQQAAGPDGVRLPIVPPQAILLLKARPPFLHRHARVPRGSSGADGAGEPDSGGRPRGAERAPGPAIHARGGENRSSADGRPAGARSGGARRAAAARASVAIGPASAARVGPRSRSWSIELASAAASTPTRASTGAAAGDGR